MKTLAAALAVLFYVTGNAMADELTHAKVFPFAKAPAREPPIHRGRNTNARHPSQRSGNRMK